MCNVIKVVFTLTINTDIATKYFLCLCPPSKFYVIMLITHCLIVITCGELQLLCFFHLLSQFKY